MPKVFPKRTVFCCFAFDEKAVMLLGYSIALAFFACAFLWQSSMQLMVPLAMGHDKSLVYASCDVQTAQVVCLDSWESECHTMLDVKVGNAEDWKNSTNFVELKNYYYPTYSIPKVVAARYVDLFAQSPVQPCYYWGDIAAPNNILYFVRPVVVGVGQWVGGLIMLVFGAGAGIGMLICLFLALRDGWRYGSCSRAASEGYFFVEMEDYGINGHKSPEYATPKDVESPPPAIVSDNTALIDRPNRIAFMRKVFFTLFFQFAITFGIVSICVLVPHVRDWLLVGAPFWFIYVAMAVGFISIFPLFCFADRFPLNIVLITLVSSGIGFLVGVVATMYSVRVIFHACILLLVVLVAVTAFTLTARRGVYSYFGAMLAAVVALTAACLILGFFLPFPSAAQAVCAIIGVFVWTVFLLWDMAVIANYFDEDQWALGAVTIYLDSINILLFLLRFLGGRSRQ